MTGAGARRIGAVAAAVLAAAATLTGGAAPAAPVSYTCSGVASTDQASLQQLIDAGGSITLAGPRACVGNFVASDVTVTITGGAGATVDGGGTGSIFLLDDANVTLANLTLTHGRGSGPDEPDDPPGANGGAVSMGDSTLTVDHCRIVDNVAEDQGGGIHAAESMVTIVDSTVSDNTSEEGGGGIDADDDVDLTITRSTFGGNTTGPHGGGVELFDGTLTMTDSTITGNSVTDSADFRSGGGIWVGLADVSITNSTIRNNRSSEFGGGIGYSGGPGTTFTLTGSTITGNQAAVGGGGIRNDAYYGDAPLVVDHSTIAGNAAGEGGGIDAYALHGFTSSVSLTSSAVSANRAQNLGGGINAFVDPSGGTTSVSVASTVIGSRGGRVNDGNRARFGAGIAANGAYGSATVALGSDSALIANLADVDGGGVFTRNGARLVLKPGVVMRLNAPSNVG